MDNHLPNQKHNSVRGSLALFFYENNNYPAPNQAVLLFVEAMNKMEKTQSFLDLNKIAAIKAKVYKQC